MFTSYHSQFGWKCSRPLDQSKTNFLILSCKQVDKSKEDIKTIYYLYSPLIRFSKIDILKSSLELNQIVRTLQDLIVANSMQNLIGLSMVIV